MIKKTFLIILGFLSTAIYAEQADEHQLIRRLYLDVIGRLPEVSEFVSAEKTIRSVNGYSKLVDQLLGTQEFKENLSFHIARHYGPGFSVQSTIGMERARQYIEKKYLTPNSNFKTLVSDILTAKGIEAYNPLVRFYSPEDTPLSLTDRFTERVLGIPLGCAQCHDHKFYPELLQKDYWGLASFFNSTKVQHITTDAQLKKLRKEVQKAGASALGDKVYFNTWLFQEANKQSILFDRKMSYNGSTPYGSNYSMMQEEDGMESSGKQLLDPQLIIYEPKISTNQVKIQREISYKNYEDFRARLPLEGKIDRGRDHPRNKAAVWMTGSNLKFFDRATANWVVNWLLGKGIKMPVTDIYFLEPEEEEELQHFAAELKRVKYNLPNFIKSIILSSKYRLRNRTHANDGDFDKLRALRYLSGRQMAESFFHELDKEASLQKEGNKRFTSRTWVEFKKVQLMEDTFPAALEPQLYGTGTVMQSQLTASSERWLDYIDDLANEGFKNKTKTPERCLTEDYVRLFTRYPTIEEIEYLTGLVNRQRSFSNSNFKEVVWALVNSPEMRVY